MKFRTSLDGLLRWRIGLERIARLEVGRLNGEIKQVEAENERLKVEKAEVQARLGKVLSLGVRAAEFSVYSVVALEERVKAAARELDGLQVKKVSVERQYLEARRERKVVEMSIERLRLTYEKEIGRKDQLVRDHDTLQRMGREQP